MTHRSGDAPFQWISDRLSRDEPRSRLLVDGLTSAAIIAVSLIGLHTQNRLGPHTIAFAIALCAPLPLHRRSPVACFVIVASVAFVQWLVSAPQLADFAVLASLYWLALKSRSTTVAAAAATVEIGAVIAAIRWSPSDPVKIWVGLSGLAVAAAVLGITVRQRRALLLSLQERAARLEFERDQEGRLAAAAERARIARELHDIVSHNLTVMIALADAATYAAESAPDEATPAMRRVSATGRQALLEMRRLLGVLRDEPTTSALEPQPGLDRLGELIERVESAGIPVILEVDGDPEQLSEGVQLAVYRVAQEALTNILKHAVAPTDARVLLRCRDHEVELEVTDTGQPRSPGQRADSEAGAGRGLRGMRERAAAYGGELEAGPLAGGGWRVRLRLHAERDVSVA